MEEAVRLREPDRKLELTRFRRRCWGKGRRRSPMPRTHPPYAPEYRRRIVELARAGRKLDELAREFEPSANAIRKWVKQAALDEGLRSDGLTTSEREETQPLAPREPHPARRARDPCKSRGLVRSGDRRDAAAAFAFVGANRAMHRIATMCRALEVSCGPQKLGTTGLRAKRKLSLRARHGIVPCHVYAHRLAALNLCARASAPRRHPLPAVGDTHERGAEGRESFSAQATGPVSGTQSETAACR